MNKQYEQYVEECHSPNAGDISTINTIEILDATESYPLWTSQGIAGGYKWRSLTTLFDPELHFIDQKKSKINDMFLALTSQSGLHMMSHLAKSMSVDKEFSILLNDSNLLIANSDVLFAGLDFEKDRALGMIDYLRQNLTLNDDDCFLVQDNSLDKYNDNIKDVNILFPMPVLMKNRMELFAKISKALCMRGAKTVYGVFLTYSVPSVNGEEPHRYPNIPPIKGLSFSDLMNIM